MKSILIAGLLSTLPVFGVEAAVIVSGSATMTLKEGMADSIGFLDAYFGDASTRAETLSIPAPGTLPFERLSGTPGTLGTSTAAGSVGTPGVVELSDAIRPYGETVPAGTPGGSRSKQETNLDFDPGNILESWAASTDSFGIFAPLGSGEQIAFTSMQRWGGDFTGALLYGDFALRYVPTRAGTVTSGGLLSGLVLTSNIDFLDASWADLANATISFDELTSTLSISGDLLISGALNVLDSSAMVGTNFGTFSLTATVVPEPPGWVFAGAGLLLLGAVGKLRRKRVA